MLFAVRFVAVLLCAVLSFSAFAVEACRDTLHMGFCRRHALQQLREKNRSKTLHRKWCGEGSGQCREELCGGDSPSGNTTLSPGTLGGG